MPFKSKAQVRKFGAMVRRGEISQAKFREWLNKTPSVKKLPERKIRRKKKVSRKIRRKCK